MTSGSCLHEIFEARVREAPGRVAVTAPGGNATYQELDAMADRLAGRLRERGVRPDTLVGLCGDRDVSLLAGMLGILKAGGAYLPIDPTYPQERIRLLLADSGITTVVGSGTGIAAVGDSGVEVVGVDDRPPASGGERLPDPDRQPASPAVAPHHLAYVIYTSGSTGTPKGVAVEHRNVVRLFSSTAGWFNPSDRDVWSMFHSASFDFSVWEIWGALLHGGRLVIVPPAVTRAPLDLLALLRREGVTVLSQTPSAFRQLVAADSGAERSAGLDLRLVVFGGERLDPGMLRPWVRRYGDERPRLVNMYGITETTVHVTYRRIRASDLDRPEESPIGVPIPDLRVTLHDEHGAQVPEGTPGEIWVSGDGVARGYHRRPDLTAERFVTGPDGVRAYRSGDRAIRNQGDLAYLGRIDDQIKVRGFRIEPREVEAVLGGHPAVAGAVVAGRDHGDGDLRLAAYVQPAPGALPDGDGEHPLIGELRQYAAANLPEYLRPSDYLVVGEIPRTPQGKADRSALARAGAAGGGTGPAADPGDSERAVSTIVRDVLHQEVAPDVDMFDQGATSLAMVRIIMRVNEQFGVSLTGSELGGAASIRNLAAAVDAVREPVGSAA